MSLNNNNNNNNKNNNNNNNNNKCYVRKYAIVGGLPALGSCEVGRSVRRI
jgi:hypothetical protein